MTKCTVNILVERSASVVINKLYTVSASALQKVVSLLAQWIIDPANKVT